MAGLIHTTRAALTRLRDMPTRTLFAGDAVEASARLIAECLPHLGDAAVCTAVYTCDVVCLGRTGSPLRDEPLQPPPHAAWQPRVAAFAKARGQVAEFHMRLDHEAIVEEIIDRTLSMSLGDLVAVPSGPAWSLRYMPRGNRRRPVQQPMRNAA